MADENIDLHFLAEQGRKILAEIAEARTERIEIRSELFQMRAEQKEMRAEQQSFARLLGKVSDAVSELAVSVAALSVDLKATKEAVEEIREIQANQGARLNVIEGRLAIIEKHTGLVKA